MRRPEAIFLDFDGVILESLELKNEAMGRLFADRPEHLDAIVRYHLSNAGMSRYEKFRYYYRELFREPLSEERVAELDRGFNAIIWERLQKVPLVAGAREFLENWHGRIPLFVLSAAPEREILQIVGDRGIAQYFVEIHGSPTPKKEHLGRLLRERRLEPSRCLFVGDGSNDYEAARLHGVPFVQRLTPGSPEPFGPDVLAAIEDLRVLAALWEGRGPWLSRAQGPAPLARLRAGGGRWVYLGRDFLNLKRWDRALGTGFERIDIHQSLQNAGQSLKAPFLAWLRDLSRRHGSLEWWSSRIADENTLSGSLFGELCYLKAALDLLEGPNPPVLIVAENEGLLRALERARGGRRLAPWDCAAADLRWAALWALRWAKHFCRGALAWLSARSTGSCARLADKKPLALIHTWVDAGYFSNDGPRDAYFTELAEQLRRRGLEPVVLPYLYDPRRSPREAFRWLRGHGSHLIAEDYYRPSDYLWSARVLWRQGALPSLPQRLAGLDIAELVADARRQSMANASQAPFIQYTRLFERLASSGLSPRVFIDTFENAAAEKPALLALRRFFPKALSVGYQHWASPAPLMLQHFAAVAPEALPDVIVCSGRFSLERFAEEGLPRARLRLGPSLRYRHLLAGEPRQNPEPRRVFVPLSLDLSWTVELLSMLLEAFPTDEGPRFWLKPHPMMPEGAWNAALGSRLLPAHFELVSGGMEEWARRACCAVVGGSSSSMDLALAGVPLVVAARQAALDYNPLAYFPEIPAPAHGSAALRAQLLRLLSLPETERARWSENARRMRQDCLSPINDETIDAFLAPAAEEPCAA